jgi:hypothetical protein
MATEFEIEGRRFQVKALAPEDSCLGLEILGKLLGPAMLSALTGVTAEMTAEEIGERLNVGSLVASLVGQASQLAALLKLFAPVTQFDRANNGNWVDVKLFTGELFGGRMDVLVAFLVQAVRAEYTCFLGGSNALGPLLAAFAKPSKSPTAPTP